LQAPIQQVYSLANQQEESATDHKDTLRTRNVFSFFFPKSQLRSLTICSMCLCLDLLIFKAMPDTAGTFDESGNIRIRRSLNDSIESILGDGTGKASIPFLWASRCLFFAETDSFLMSTTDLFNLRSS
jgi:hypothetical protein